MSVNKKLYRRDEQSVISFSGGRTSGYMLWRILDAYDGKLPDHIKVCFANTGKEMPQTLDFVRDCSEAWGVDIVWLEFVKEKKAGRVVTWEAASRNGEPFYNLISQKKFIPNDRIRTCTEQLKVVPINKYMESLGYDEFLTFVGIRADEHRRVAKMRARPNYIVPLADAGVTLADVDAFWSTQEFQLNLPLSENGNSPMSNCDLCFFKSLSRKLSIIRERPDLADWWIEQEERIGNTFRRQHPSYRDMKIIATDQVQLFEFENESMSCFCGD
jgi:3'-phosphoadenosine 5'-phosphosulfate sulfotransferase (PAPS reductase)/FAD synthetase